MLQDILDADLLLTQDVLTVESAPRYSYKFNPLPVNPTKKMKKVRHENRDEDDPYCQKVEGISLLNVMATIMHPLFGNAEDLKPTRE